MKKKMFLLIVLLGTAFVSVSAQKFALVDMEYILKNIPAYERANEQLDQTSKKWQSEVEDLNSQAKKMYTNYQNEIVFLSADQKKVREKAILDKEKEASDLKKNYFSPEGELYKKRESLVSPIQDEIYAAVKAIAEQHNYQLVLDRASDNGIVFASPSADISNEVLSKLGYSK